MRLFSSHFLPRQNKCDCKLAWVGFGKISKWGLGGENETSRTTTDILVTDVQFLRRWGASLSQFENWRNWEKLRVKPEFS